MRTLEEQLADFLSGYPQFKLAILFGSQATGGATGESDIDLALLSDAPISGSLKLKLVEQIGAGAFGVVWSARDEELDRIVALKMIRSADLASDEEVRLDHFDRN